MKKPVTTAEEREKFARQVRLCYWRLLRLLDDRQGDGGLTEMQLLLLRVLEREGTVPAGEVPELLGVTPADVTGLTDRLSKRKMVRRVRDVDDRRRVFLVGTETGRRAYAQSAQRRDEILDSVLRGLPSARRGQFLDDLAVVLRSLESQEESRPRTVRVAPTERSDLLEPPSLQSRPAVPGATPHARQARDSEPSISASTP